MTTTIYYHPETGKIVQASVGTLPHVILGSNLPSITVKNRIKINEWRVNTTTLELEPISK
jgi:hypothetical protein